ncbi:extracellular solute-binding protein [Paenibacillus chartarius]|uniref:Extracellular solute-binding protein n=1 Tax=Paenibacillus chartarius TaxID=747481 RepID=A0ABV6DPS9_9BACL
MLPLHHTKVPDAASVEAVNQTAGVKLDIDWVPNDIYTDRIRNAIETNSLRMVTSVTQPDYESYGKNAIRSGIFWEIGPYLSSYPNLRNLDKQILNDIAVDGKIYGLYTQRPSSRQGVILRKDWLDKLNEKEPASIDELYHIMKRFTTGDPDGNGANDTIGLADRKDLMYGAFKTLSSYFGTPNNWSVSGGKLVPEFMSPEYMDTMNFMKKLYNEGVVNPDFAVTSKQIQRYMFISGKAGIYIGALTDAPRLLDEMKKLNPKAELTLVNRIKGPKGYGVWSIPRYSSVLLFSKKTIPTEEDLKNVLAFFDRTLDADVANLLAYGQPGKAYVEKSGKAVLKPEMADYKNTEVFPFLPLMINNLNNPNLLPIDEASLTPLTVMADKLVADNENILIVDPAQHLASPTNETRGSELSQFIANATYDYILGHIDGSGFAEAIATWRSRGGDKIIEEYNEAYRSAGAKS